MPRRQIVSATGDLAERKLKGSWAITDRQVLTFKLLVSAVFFISAWRVLFEGHNWGDDFGLYLQLAKNIRNGDPYNHLNTGIEVPPGFPLLLAIWSKLFGVSFVGLKCLNIASWLVAAWIGSALATRALGRLAGILVFVAHFIVPMYYVQQQSVLSDPPFLVFVNLTLLLSYEFFKRIRQSTLISQWMFVGVPVSLFLAMLIRPAGLPLAVAVVGSALIEILLQRNNRVVIGLCVRMSGLVIIAMGLYFFLFGASAGGHLANAMSAADPNDGKIFALIMLVSRRALEETVNLYHLFAGYPVQNFLACVFVGMLLVGGILYIRLSRDKVLPTFVLAYVGLLLIIPWQQGFRYLFPIVSVALIFFLAPAVSLFLKIGGEVDKRKVTPLKFAAVLSVAVLCGLMTRGTGIYFRYNDDEISDENSLALIDWLAKNTQPTEMLCGFKPRALMYFTSRRVCYIPNEPMSDPLRYMNELDADWAILILRPAYGYQSMDDFFKISAEMQERYRNNAYVVYRHLRGER
jgi:cytochrome c oxidase subunit 4